MRFLIVIYLLLLVLTPVSDADAQSDDIVMYIHESMINKLLKAMGPVSDTGTYKLMLIKSRYVWVLENPRIELQKGHARFLGNVYVETGPLKYRTQLDADMAVSYAPLNNRIELTINQALFPLKTRWLGKEKHITDIDLAGYFKEPFYFEGPVNMTEPFDIEMPDGSLKTLYASIKSFHLDILDGKLLLKSNVDFQDFPPADENSQTSMKEQNLNSATRIADDKNQESQNKTEDKKSKKKKTKKKKSRRKKEN